MSTKKKSTASAVMEPKFTKESLVNSKRFRNERDIVSALLKDDVEYTVSEVADMIADYMKGKVK
jgi:arginine repressor